MSGLAAILAGHTEPGVYRWHGAFDAQEVRHTVEHAGWRFGYVDGWLAQTKSEFLVSIGLALDFPGHYGRNFDALTDCLREVSADPGAGVVLLWDGWGPLATDDHPSFETALSVLRERTESEDPFAVLLRGDGPDLADVASID